MVKKRTSAENVTLDLLGRSQSRRIVRFRQITLELGLANHLLKVRASLRVTKEVLGEEHDKL